MEVSVALHAIIYFVLMAFFNYIYFLILYISLTLHCEVFLSILIISNIYYYYS